jgi:hypothetical protein
MRPAPPAATLAGMNPRVVAVITAAAGLALLAAACSTGSGSPSTPAAAAGSTTAAGGLLGYSSCMRSHGVPNFPDPASSGGLPKETPQQLGVGDSMFDAAQSACLHLIPAGENLGGQPIQTITAQQQQYYLKAAACMRSHGITNFPEPDFSGGQVEFPMLEHLVDLNSPQFISAYHVCQKLIPPGLPDSGSGDDSGS